jgi:hypothetical protein
MIIIISHAPNKSAALDCGRYGIALSTSSTKERAMLTFPECTNVYPAACGTMQHQSGS